MLGARAVAPPTRLRLAITIIALPLAVANAKLVPAALWPFGQEIVRSADVSAALAAYRAHQAKAQAQHELERSDPAAGRAPEGCRGSARVGARRAEGNVSRLRQDRDPGVETDIAAPAYGDADHERSTELTGET